MSLKKNIVYSSILTVSGYLFPFITFPYVTRVLGVENFGICSFYDSILTYFTLISMMGMSTLGIREIASCNGDKDKLCSVFSSLFSLNLIATVIALLLMLGSALFVNKFQEHPQMMLIGAAKLLANFFMIEWFFRGIEEFQYVTVRSILVRAVYVVSVFIFVRQSEDYLLYFLLTALMFVVNAAINMLYVRRFVTLTFSNIRITNYIRPFIVFGAYQILTSMYTSFNVAYLGFVSSDTEVGYYSSSVKLFNILLSFYTAFTGVLLPRMSSLYHSGDLNGFNKLLLLSFKVLVFIVFPIIILSEFYAPEIVTIMSGSSFGGAVLPMRIIMPLLLIIGIEQILVYQILIPQNKDQKVFVNSIVGGLIGVIANLILVKELGSSGSAVVWLLSEVCVLTMSYYFTFSIIKGIPILRIIIKRIIYSIPLIFFLAFLKAEYSGVISFIVSCLVVACYYFIIEMTVDKKSTISILLPKNLRRNTKDC